MLVRYLLWIPAFAGMTREAVGMTMEAVGMTRAAVGITREVAGMTDIDGMAGVVRMTDE